MTLWTNQAPKPFDNIPKTPASQQFANIPDFKITGGTINGTTPSAYKITAPTPINFQKAIDSVKTFFTIQH